MIAANRDKERTEQSILQARLEREKREKMMRRELYVKAIKDERYSKEKDKQSLLVNLVGLRVLYSGPWC